MLSRPLPPRRHTGGVGFGCEPTCEMVEGEPTVPRAPLVGSYHPGPGVLEGGMKLPGAVVTSRPPLPPKPKAGGDLRCEAICRACKG